MGQLDGLIKRLLNEYLVLKEDQLLKTLNVAPPKGPITSQKPPQNPPTQNPPTQPNPAAPRPQVGTASGLPTAETEAIQIERMRETVEQGNIIVRELKVKSEIKFYCRWKRDDEITPRFFGLKNLATGADVSISYPKQHYHTRVFLSSLPTPD